MVFLPGRGDDIEAYQRGGFIERMHALRLPVDAVVVDAHLGYYIDRSLSERVYEDVLKPYQASGYRQIVLVGVSLGGVGALRLKFEYPELISGVVLIAPFLGDERTVRSINNAASLRDWRQELHEPLQPEEEIWTWVDTMFDDVRGIVPCTILAYGQDDRFRSGAEYFAGLLPKYQVFTDDGGHNWPTWQRLWSEILQSGHWQQLDCAPTTSSVSDVAELLDDRRTGP